MKIVQMEEKKNDGRYDSDGEIGPFIYLKEIEGKQMFEETKLDKKILSNKIHYVATDRKAEESKENYYDESDKEQLDTNATGMHVYIEQKTLMKYSRDELKEQLCLRGQQLSGNKHKILDHL